MRAALELGYRTVMAFGFPAYHEEDVQLSAPMTPHTIPAVFHRLGWSGSANQDGRSWRAVSGMNLASWGEEIQITWVAEAVIRVRSNCSMPTQCLDWGRNKKNVMAFKQALYQLSAQGFGYPPG
jgi:hypothetical protein